MVYRPESLLKRLEKLREYSRDLLDLGNITFEGYLKDKKGRYSMERLLFLICENIIDFLDHVLASRFEVVSDSYEEIIENAYKVRLIPNSLFTDLKGLGGFRNILAHEYLNLSEKEVFRNFEKMKRILPTVISTFENLLAAR